MGTLHEQSHFVDLESANPRNGDQDPTTSGGSVPSGVAGESPVEVTDLEGGADESKLRLGKNARDCRICHLNNQDSGPLFELGCSCRDDLAVAHKQCAEAWFKIKGNKICEICGSLARNVSGADDTELAQPHNGSNGPAIMATTVPESGNICQNHRVLNFLLACMVFAFIISWLFHFIFQGLFTSP